VGLVVAANEARPRYAFLFTDVIVLCTAVDPPPAAKKSKKEEKEPPAPAVKIQLQLTPFVLEMFSSWFFGFVIVFAKVPVSAGNVSVVGDGELDQGRGGRHVQLFCCAIAQTDLCVSSRVGC
jgi:hypothetical protein